MRKLKLDLDSLAVDTFVADEQPGGAGTVRSLDAGAAQRPTTTMLHGCLTDEPNCW
ncbi:MAG TPA: hypothetical protein VGO40_16050 [Longimicrobium sp.]|jgi:hypothetical protein|nr:hypothetical protein [Longimicrobium sp.]